MSSKVSKALVATALVASVALIGSSVPAAAATPPGGGGTINGSVEQLLTTLLESQSGTTPTGGGDTGSTAPGGTPSGAITQLISTLLAAQPGNTPNTTPATSTPNPHPTLIRALLGGPSGSPNPNGNDSTLALLLAGLVGRQPNHGFVGGSVITVLNELAEVRDLAVPHGSSGGFFGNGAGSTNGSPSGTPNTQTPNTQTPNTQTPNTANGTNNGTNGSGSTVDPDTANGPAQGHPSLSELLLGGGLIKLCMHTGGQTPPPPGVILTACPLI
jgi:hypothetical protein